MYKKSKFCKHGKKGCRKQQIMIERSLYYVGILPACMHDVVVRYFCIQKYSYTKYLLRNINQKMKWDFRYLSSRKRIGIYEAIIVGRLLCSITSRYYNMAASASWLFWGWWWRKNTTASVYIWVWPHPHKHAAHRGDTRHVVLHVAEAVYLYYLQSSITISSINQ